MRVSLNWLRDFVEVEQELGDLTYSLTMLGLEVDRVDTLVEPGLFEGIVVGRIEKLQRHPGSPGLWVGLTNIGDRTVSLVSAAENLFEGALIPVVLPGFTLPNGVRIEPRDFAGVVSEGMMVSARELGVPNLDRPVSTEAQEGEAHEDPGILILDKEASPGQTLAAALHLEEPVLELDLTPNYAAHAQSVVGVARELSALTGRTLHMPGDIPRGVPPALDPPVSDYAPCGDFESAARAKVTVVDNDMCPRYGGLMIENVRIDQSPLWMRERLLQAGVRPINNVVDITNYVMLELGQPLHAFDYDTLTNGHIIVRPAKEGETLRTLDGVMRQLKPTDLLISTEDGPIGLAGVMGGLNSEITPDTRAILLESAHFDSRTILRTARRLGLVTEASKRFEKGMDYNVTVPALLRSAQLFAELDAGTPARTFIDVVGKDIGPRVIHLRPERVTGIMGVELAPEEVADYLRRLGFVVEGRDGRKMGESGTLQVTVPSYRPDVEGEIDLVEEVARLYGYDRLPVTVPSGSPSREIPTHEDRVIRAARRLLTGAGLNEALTFSFTDAGVAERMRWDPGEARARQIPLANPMTRERSYLRASLAPSLLDVMSYNARQRINDVCIFEVGRVYRPKELPLEELPGEPLLVAIGMMGHRVSRGWNSPDREVDFYELKGVAELLLDGLGVHDYAFRAGREPHLHPGRTAILLVSGQPAGWLGELHPEIAEQYELSGRAYLAELDFTRLVREADVVPAFEPVPTVPAVVRDLAIVVDKSVPATAVKQVIETASGDIVEEVKLFDVYEGDPVPEGKRSMAYSVTYRADHTLTDEEVAVAHDRIRRALVQDLGVELRS